MFSQLQTKTSANNVKEVLYMLATQVEYWKYKEGARHNLATESLQSESNAIAREQVSVNWFTAHENQRHNQQQEAIGWTNANENIRHNMVTEGIQRDTLNETRRHNRVQEDIGYQNAYANVSQANAAQRRASIDFGRLTLDQQMQPYKIASQEAQTYKAKSESVKTQAETAKIPFDMKMRTVEFVGNLWSGTLGSALNAWGRYTPRKYF
nr:hypothetical protein [Picobirnavirus sp.]